MWSTSIVACEVRNLNPPAPTSLPRARAIESDTRPPYTEEITSSM